MTFETLESLLLDRALGHLSPEVAALLDSHLAQNPAAASEADALAQTVGLARSALADTPGAARPLPPFTAHRLLDQRRRQSRFRFLAATAGMAACLALGILLAHRPSPAVSSPPPALAQAGAVASAPPAASPNDFWSASRLKSLAAKPVPPAPAKPQNPFDLLKH